MNKIKHRKRRHNLTPRVPSSNQMVCLHLILIDVVSMCFAFLCIFCTSLQKQGAPLACFQKCAQMRLFLKFTVLQLGLGHCQSWYQSKIKIADKMSPPAQNVPAKIFNLQPSESFGLEKLEEQKMQKTSPKR